MLARMDPRDTGVKDGKFEGLVYQVNAQYPGLIEKMLPSAATALRYNRDIGIQPASGQTHQEAGPLKLPDEFRQAVSVFAGKLAKGVFYMNVGSPFPQDGCLLLNWFTNADVIRDGGYVAFDALKHLAGGAPLLERGGKYLNDQFEYKLSLADAKDVFVLQSLFGGAFGFVVFGSTNPGLLEGSVDRLRAQTNKNGPFTVLQSTILSS